MSKKSQEAIVAIIGALEEGYKMSIEEIDSMGYPRAIERALALECAGLRFPHHTQHYIISTAYKNLEEKGTLTGEAHDN